MTQAPSRLPLPNLIAFSLPGFSIGALAVALTVYLPHYYATHYGLALAAVGGAFAVIRFGDMFIDPLLGLAMDRTRTRFGRYKVWLVAGAPVLMLAVYMLFSPPAGVGLIYLAGWLLVYYLGFSLLLLSHSAWASVIAAKYHERSRTFGVIQLVSILGATLVLAVPALMARRDGSSGTGDVAGMGWFIVIAAPIGVAAAVLATRETIVREVSAERFGLRDYWEMISRPDMRRIIIADFCLALGPGWMSSLYLFYFHDSRGFTIARATTLLGIYIAAGIIGAAALATLAQRLGKHRTLQVASTGYSLGLIGIAFVPKGDYAIAAALMFVQGFLAAGFPLLDRAMVADVGDAVRLEKGKQRTGLLYAMISTTQKLAGSASIGLSYILLGVIGYKAKDGAANTAAAIHGMELVYILVPIVFVMLGGAVYIGYRLDSDRHADIRAQLEARDAELTEPPILESLTGDQGVATRLAGG
ncbi:MAG TPA: MFS transporter [Caulobacteraceae bacterium]|nr:MFS transporter [Caulobacteraceae bacterium]